MGNSRQIFQQKALDKLKSPARQDTLFSVVPPMGWGILLSVAMVIISALVWSVFGVMADKVSGFGIIVDTAGVSTISSVSGGRVCSLLNKINDRVNREDIVAVIEQEELEQKIFFQVEHLNNSSNEAAVKGNTTELSSLREQQYDRTRVKSPYDGIITNIRVHEGDIVKPGEAIYDIRRDQHRQDIVAIVYLPALTGSKLTEGMTVHISPGAFEQTEEGSLVGRVMSVSAYPVTTDRIVYWTGNRELASWILQQNGGTVVEATVELVKDSETKTGYLWTSMKGPDGQLLPGMTCTAQAIVKRQPPLTKAFNKLAQWVRSD